MNNYIVYLRITSDCNMLYEFPVEVKAKNGAKASFKAITTGIVDHFIDNPKERILSVSVDLINKIEDGSGE